MSTNTIPYYYTLIHNALDLHTDPSVILYTSMDLVIFDRHPSPIYGCHPLNDLSFVLPELTTKFAIQASNSLTRRAVDLAPYPQGEVNLDSGLSVPVRVVDDARDLISLRIQHYEAVFIRTDGSLVIWGDDEGTTLQFWLDIVSQLQMQSGTATPTTTSVAGLPGNDGINPEDTILPAWGNAPLSSLDEFFYLFTFSDSLPTWDADPQGYHEGSSYPSWQQMLGAEPSEGSLGFALPQRARSPSFSDVTTASSSLVSSPSTADLGGAFPSYAPSVYVGEEDEVGANISLDFSLSFGERGVSPALSSAHCTVAAVPCSTPPVAEQANSSPSSRQHSVVEASIPESFAHGIDQKATREGEEADDYSPELIVNVNGFTSDAATGNTDVDPSFRGASNIRALKRSRSVVATGTAPARLTIPLPDVEYVQPAEEDNLKRRKFLAIAPAPSPTLASASASSSASAPTFPSPSASVPTPASGRPQRRPGNRRRGGGTTRSAGKNARGKRHPCEYCGKTFSRLQDQQRHSTTSCNASPHRSTVDCPECGAILSRLDAAQRHWRGHENPTCPTPDWVSGRS